MKRGRCELRQPAEVIAAKTTSLTRCLTPAADAPRPAAAAAAAAATAASPAASTAATTSATPGDTAESLVCAAYVAGMADAFVHCRKYPQGNSWTWSWPTFAHTPSRAFT